MRVLVACEFSGAVRDAFRARGHDVLSVDLLPSEAEGPHHTGSVFDVLDRGWDLIVAHPPCTYLAKSGVRWLHSEPPNPVNRWELMEDAAWFFRTLLEAPAPRIAVENPVMHRYAREIVGRAHSQVVQPWEYGHAETKKTCLWLVGLPPLMPTSDWGAYTRALPKYEQQRIIALTPSPDRWKDRSVTYPGIAEAMADQWGSYD